MEKNLKGRYIYIQNVLIYTIYFLIYIFWYISLYTDIYFDICLYIEIYILVFCTSSLLSFGPLSIVLHKWHLRKINSSHSDLKLCRDKHEREPGVTLRPLEAPDFNPQSFPWFPEILRFLFWLSATSSVYS